MVIACQLTLPSAHRKDHHSVRKPPIDPVPRIREDSLPMSKDQVPIPMITPVLLHLHQEYANRQMVTQAKDGIARHTNNLGLSC